MAGLSPDESLAIAHDNARLTSTLRRVRRRVRRALTHAESATRLAEPSAELTGVVQELRAVLEDSAHVSEHPVPNNERGAALADVKVTELYLGWPPPRPRRHAVGGGRGR